MPRRGRRFHPPHGFQRREPVGHATTRMLKNKAEGNTGAQVLIREPTSLTRWPPTAKQGESSTGRRGGEGSIPRAEPDLCIRTRSQEDGRSEVDRIVGSESMAFGRSGRHSEEVFGDVDAHVALPVGFEVPHDPAVVHPGEIARAPATGKGGSRFHV